MRGRSALLALFLLAGAGPARADFASEALLHDFVGTIEASPDWSAAARVVRSEGGDTIAEGLVFSRQAPDVSIRIERLRLRDLREEDEGGFSAGEIEMTGAALVSEQTEVTVPAAFVRDVSIPGSEGLVFDTSRLMTFVSRLYSVMADAEFADFSVPEMVAVPRRIGADGAPAEGRIVYRNVSVAGLQNGVLRISQAGPVSFEGRDAEGESRMEVQSVTTERFDLGALAHVFDEAAYRDGRGDAIWRPLVSKIGYSGLSASGPDGTTIRLAAVAVENVDARQPDEPMVAVWDKLLDPSISEDAKSDLALEALRGMASAWRVGTIRIEGLDIQDPSNSASAGLAAFTVTGLSNAGIDSVILTDAKAQSSDGFARLESFELAGFVFPDAEALMKFAALENDSSKVKHDETVRNAFAALPRLAHLGVRGFAGGKSETESVSMALLTLDLRNWNEIYATQTDLRIEGVAVPVSLMQLDPTQLQVMDTLGLDRLVLGASMSDRWSPDAGTDDATWTMTLENGADVELTYRLVGVTVDWLLAASAVAGDSPDAQAAFAAMLNDLRLASARLAVTDRSLLDRAFGVAAEKQGLSVDGKAYREQMRGALPFLLSAALPAELSKLVSPPLQAFMAGGQTLIAEIAPAAPLPILELAAGAEDPLALVDRLGLTMRSEAPAQ